MDISQNIIRKTGYLILLMMVFFSGFLLGQEVTVSARLDSSRALIGDQLTLHLRVEKSAGAHVAFPHFADTLSGKIEIIRKSPVDTVAGPAGRTVLNQDLLITVFDTGTIEIPPQPFAFQNGQLKDTLFTRAVLLQISSLPLDTTIRDIKANMRTPVNAQELFPWILGLLALAVLVILIVYIVKKIRGKDIKTTLYVPSEPADVIALRQLEQLRVEKPWIQKPVKMYYINLTDILRHYMERRYHIMALEQTTEEILKDLKKTGCSSKNLEKISSILKLADLVKFAKLIPDEYENGIQVEEAIGFVKNTTPVADENNQDGTTKQDAVQSNVES
jgi:hypothetical protein